MFAFSTAVRIDERHAHGTRADQQVDGLDMCIKG
jgi:hypothetical protein